MVQHPRGDHHVCSRAHCVAHGFVANLRRIQLDVVVAARLHAALGTSQLRRAAVERNHAIEGGREHVQKRAVTGARVYR